MPCRQALTWWLSCSRALPSSLYRSRALPRSPSSTPARFCSRSAAFDTGQSTSPFACSSQRPHGYRPLTASDRVHHCPAFSLPRGKPAAGECPCRSCPISKQRPFHGSRDCVSTNMAACTGCSMLVQGLGVTRPPVQPGAAELGHLPGQDMFAVTEMVAHRAQAQHVQRLRIFSGEHDEFPAAERADRPHPVCIAARFLDADDVVEGRETRNRFGKHVASRARRHVVKHQRHGTRPRRSP